METEKKTTMRYSQNIEKQTKHNIIHITKTLKVKPT